MKAIGIAGASGSGKTTLAFGLKQILEKKHTVTVLSTDRYYRGKPADQIPKTINFDHPASIDFALLSQHLQMLKQGKSVLAPNYDFSAHQRTPSQTPLSPTELLILEGTLLLTSSQIRLSLDYSLFLDTPLDLCLLRRIRRDRKHRGRSTDSILSQYLTTVRPMFFEFVLPTKSYAHKVISDLKIPLQTLASEIENLFRK